jgi:ribosomal protein L37AE/L43A
MKTNFMGKCYAGMNSMVTGMKRSNLNWKQDGKAAEAEKTIHTMTREIGNLTVVMLDGDRSVGPDIKERYSAILEARKLMAEAEAGKKHTKTVCPHCGKKSSAGMHYCGWCGEALADGALIAELN